ncbi:phage head spike fiber domain-containing protein [Aeromonas caviae]|uniref:phage head spike fiber domain-containing protein n=1 Tax=Aeromonas caviae TaxID=648 RepID=UPI002B48A9D7|nr:hypothetical protein [Aeromonas caviae]
MAGVWKRDGTVAVTNGNKKVTGTGTTFADTKNGVAKGHLFCITSGTSVDFYEVDYVVSNTELYLVQAYRGVTATGKAYEIITTFSDSVPEFARRLTATLSAYQQQSDAFQALLTSTATTVEVTAPDGTKQTLIPWKRVTSEGEGQAARAKTEADKAAASAALAGDIVVASVLPLPDVWAPLSDSLRLITGYGRDVLVGSDVVARMVNFSRNSTATYIGKDGQLKTAAANEPRFEKEGLLIEGLSSNLIPTSTSFQAALPGVTYEQAANPAFPHPIIRVIKPSGDGDVRAINAELIAGTVYTASMYFDKNATPSAKVFYGVSSIAATMVRSGVVVGGLERYTATFTCQASGTHQIRFGSYGAAFDFVAGCPQIEPLPFASSYIPTNGAAVTRAADICWLNVAGNHFSNGTHAFYASCKNCGVVSTTLTMRFIHVEGVSQHFSVRATGNDRRLGYLNNVDTTFASGVTSFEGTIAVAPGRLSKIGNFTAQASPTFVTEDVSTKQLYIGSQGAGLHSIFGHVKNLRIWSKPLTNDQIKAIA